MDKEVIREAAKQAVRETLLSLQLVTQEQACKILGISTYKFKQLRIKPEVNNMYLVSKLLQIGEVNYREKYKYL